MRVKDIVESGSKDDVLKILKQYEDSLIKLASEIRQSKPNDEKHFLLYNLTVCSANQLKGLRLVYDLPTEFYAWIARNLFELNLTVRYILSSPENLVKFGSKRARDEIEMLKGMLKFEEMDEDMAKTIESRIDRLNQSAEKHKRILKERLSINELLKESTNMQREYNIFYKLYSKYVHPTSWLVNGPQDVIYSSEIRNTCLVNAQLYAGNIAKLILDETEISI